MEKQWDKEILETLLRDRTTKTNIIWANDNYINYGIENYAPTSQITPESITGNIIKPRALKSKVLQRDRTKTRGEVFTPTWIVEKQNSEVNRSFLTDDCETYVKRKWLEVTCGEAPYMTTRYNMETGEIIPLKDRVGFVDSKLEFINTKMEDKEEWQKLVEEAYKASYGFEWNGDSLLLARENLLYTYRDYYFAKWNEEPQYDFLRDIAEIISYNVFQMDGLKYTIPLTEKRVKVMNWVSNKMEFFDEL